MSRLSIRALSDAVKKIHFIEVVYENDTYEFPWMELQENEMPTLPSPPEDATKEEAAEISIKGLDYLTFHMVAKGSKNIGEELDQLTWDSIPRRIRNDVMMRVFNIRVEAKKDFLDHPTKT